MEENLPAQSNLAHERIVHKKRRISDIFKLPSSYLTFLLGLFISRIGDSLYTLAIPWISYELTQSALVMSSVYAISVLPVVLFGPVIGVLVDHLPRKKLMMTTDLARGTLVAIIPVLHLFGILQVWHLFAVSFCLAILNLLFDVAFVAAVPHMTTGKQYLTRANAAEKLVSQLSDLIGPILAGLAIAAFGGYNALWLDAVTFGATFLTIIKVQSLGTTVAAATLGKVVRGMKEGLSWLVGNKLNISLSLQAMVGNFGYSAAFGVLMYYQLDSLHLNAEQSSLNYALLGAGGFLGTLLVVPLERRFRRGALIPILLSVGTIGFSLIVWNRYWLMPGIAFGIVSLCNIGWNTLVQSLRQETVPPDMLGRVLGFSRMFTRLAMPLGAMTGAFISAHYGPAAVFALAAVAKLMEVVIALGTPIRKM
ncbi:MAG: macrolide transporter [Paenibacillaceae bacterium]|jgi:MFS family permease|nr:macrolide transporter [Paenibacillaceae bacterium]